MGFEATLRLRRTGVETKYGQILQVCTVRRVTKAEILRILVFVVLISVCCWTPRFRLTLITKLENWSRLMADAPPAKASTGKAPTGPKVSGTRTLVSMILLVVVLIVCAIELRAGLGHFLTLKAFNKESVSENNVFKNIKYEDANGMVAAFPSKSDVKPGEFEDTHRYYWYSLLRPLMGKSNPEVFITVDHAEPKNAVSFYTSTEGEIEFPPHDPNAPAGVAPSMGMGGPGMGGPGMGGPGMGGPGMGRPGMGGGSREGGDGKGGSNRPPMEDEKDSPKSDAAPADSAVEPANTPSTDTPAQKSDATLEPETEEAKSEVPAEPK